VWISRTTRIKRTALDESEYFPHRSLGGSMTRVRAPALSGINGEYMEGLVLTISEACAAARAGRTAIYREIREGRLRAVKNGRRTLIRCQDLRLWLESLPQKS
jgi:excisionase family DNA binding protein